MNRPSFLIVLATTLLTAGAAAQTPAMARRSYFSYGTGIGISGFHVSTAGGVTELVVPCGSSGFNSGSRYWMLLDYDTVNHTYQQSFVSPVYDSSPIEKVAVGDVLATPGPEIVIAMGNGTVEIWNQALRLRLASFPTGVTQLQSVALGDVDGDSDLDVLVCNSTLLRAVDNAGTTLWSATHGGLDLAVGQMDADPALEVALTSGYVIDCGTHAVQWQWLNGFGIDLDAADIDGDGMAEVIAGEDWNWVWAFDIDTQLPKWSLPLGDIDCIAVANADADANLEVLVGEGQWGDVRVYDSVTQQLDYTINNTEHGVTAIAVGDVDGDSQLEVVFGAGYTSTGPDYFYIADAATQAIEWTSPSLGTGWVGPARGDIDGDGDEELVCVAPAQSYGGMQLAVFDARTLDLVLVTPVINTPYSSTPYDLALFDVDGDGAAELFLANGSLTQFDWNGSGFTAGWQLNGSTGPSYRKIAIADLDGDNDFEVVLGSMQYVHVFDYGASTELWHSFYLGGEVRDLVIGNSDTRQGVEIHALSSDGNIYVFDGATRVTRAILQDHGIDRTSIGRVAGVDALLAGDANGGLFVFLHNGTRYLEIGPLPMGSGPIDSVQWVDYVNLLAIGSQGRIALHAGLSPVWTTANYGTGFGRDVSIDLRYVRIASAGVNGISLFGL